MSYPKQLFQIRPQRGFISDTPAHEAGPNFYSLARNVHFRDGFAERILGSRTAYGTAVAAANPTQLMHALNCEVNDTNFWLLFENDGTAWAIEGTNATQIDAALLQGTSNPFEHSSSLLNGLPIYSNGSDEPVYWAGANLITLPDWTATETCQFITAFKFHLFAMNISGPGGNFGSLVKWSSAAEPGTVPNSWTPAADNDAGDVELADSPGSLVCAYPLRDLLIFYKRSSMYSAQFVGGNNVFNFRKVQSASGTLTPRSVCDVNGQHFVVSDGDIILTDGTNRRSIGERRVKDWLFNQLDQNNFRNMFCTYNRARDEVLVGFPEQGSQFATLGLVYDVSQDSFGVRELSSLVAAPVGLVNDDVNSNTWNDRNDAWDSASDVWGSSTIAAARDSLVHITATQLVQQDTGDSVVLGASVGKHSMDMGEPDRLKYIRKVHVRARENFGTFLIRVGSQMEPTGPTTWSNEIACTAPQQVVNVGGVVGRYISVEVRSNASDVWKLTGIDLEAEIRGYY